MRILVVAPQPFYQERGTPIATRLLLEALQAAGHSVDVLTYHVGNDPKLPGVRVFRAPAIPFISDVPIGFSLRKVLCDLALLFRLFTLTRRTRYDVLHAVEEAVFLSLLVRAFAGHRSTLGTDKLDRLGCRVVYDMDSSLPEQLVGKYAALRFVDGVLRRLERLAIARSDLVLAVCNDLATRARGYATKTPIDVVEDVSLLGSGGVKGESENLRRGLLYGELLVLYVGNLEHYQGVDLMLDAIAKLESPPMKFVAVGGNHEDVVAYRRRVAELGLGGQVAFIGARPLAQLGPLLDQADVLVSPRLHGQNTPMKLYSYLAAGKAVLATRIRSHTQVLSDDNALLVDPTPGAVARGLDVLLRSPLLRERLALSARRLATTRYSLTQFRASLASAYRRFTVAPSGSA
ncbi:MAG TPA: glycosyltransferase [Gammaproteobacteria bacterium]|nr:glycosyltransferase [Gammaproteobacteria bacterium]